MRVEQQDTTLLLRLAGELERAGVGRVEAALERVSAHTTRVVFDLQGLSFLDSRGLITILRANERAKREPFEVVVVRPQGLASRLFTLTRAGEQLTIVDHLPRTNATTERERPVPRSRLPEPWPTLTTPPEEAIVLQSPRPPRIRA